jgi:hypothetical protein
MARIPARKGVSSSKHEIQISEEIQMPKIKNGLFWKLENLNFGFVSDFDIRIYHCQF